MVLVPVNLATIDLTRHKELCGLRTRARHDGNDAYSAAESGFIAMNRLGLKTTVGDLVHDHVVSNRAVVRQAQRNLIKDLSELYPGIFCSQSL